MISLTDKGKNSEPRGWEFKGRDGQIYFILEKSIYRGIKCIVKNAKQTGIN